MLHIDSGRGASGVVRLGSTLASRFSAARRGIRGAAAVTGYDSAPTIAANETQTMGVWPKLGRVALRGMLVRDLVCLPRRGQNGAI